MHLSDDEQKALIYLRDNCPSPDQAGALQLDRSWKSASDAKKTHAQALGGLLRMDAHQVETMAESLRSRGLVGFARRKTYFNIWITEAGHHAVIAGLPDPGGTPTAPPAGKQALQPYHSAAWEKIGAFVAGVLIVGLAAFLLIRNEPVADPNFVVVLRILMSLCAAILGGAIPGFLWIDLSIRGLLIRAGGALALFFLTFWFTPNVLPLRLEAKIDAIKEDTAMTRKDVAGLARLLAEALAPGGELVGSAKGEAGLKRLKLIRPSARARELAARIPTDAGEYALGLKAIAEERYADARIHLHKSAGKAGG